MGDVLKLAGVAPAADDAVGGAWVDAESGGEFGVGLAVEFGREGLEQPALTSRPSARYRVCRAAWREASDVGKIHGHFEDGWNFLENFTIFV